MANGNITLNVSPDSIIGSEVMKSGEYKYASVGIKVSDDEYIRISYEWKGDAIPEFVMGIMSWIQSNKEQLEDHKEEYASLKERI